jgi:K+-sensing histidine kinase KdpD
MEPENLPNSTLNGTLESFYTLVVSSLSAILARGAEDTANKQLQYLGHEAGQLTDGIDWLRMTYLTNSYNIKHKLQQKKIDDICQDLEGFVGQLAFIFNMASRIGTGELPEVIMSEFRPFGEVLFKWKDTYHLQIERKCLQIRVAELDPQDMLRPKIYADKFLFEQVVYNLVNNAEKYSYRGTKIELDCKLRNLYEHRSPHVLTVTNYGQYMAPGRDVYLPFSRRTTVENIEGLGLGLYIAWLIVEKVHGGKISHECEKYPISWFNIPLIKPYIDRFSKSENPDMIKKLEAEHERLKCEYDKILAYSDEKRTLKYNPSDEVVREEIKKPTYKVTITATIPVQERKE